MTPPLRKTASWWTQHGLGRAGALEADWVLPAVRAIVSVVTDVALDAAVAPSAPRPRVDTRCAT